ncbi:MAG: sulfite exporter TauE/SafE family protein [Moraxellaceae bacterium]|nr:sulfite exporter TauE/SafE family protein [Pseudomonadales bacterium]MCP5174909.1 sulfite exporter TauE/SafE family protein [Moraxellaceae bacterium]HQV22062.1 sulfite exporter TauE/SafE family protein [Agitococcus sp.]MCB1673142.1 sulfite exporter TauE/SafE family protein [Pseudomonadales bacterium]MCP5175916.1 sulfite exporter TauE/SafE family protein [Moraxellaceae bacterium]
MSDIYFIVAGAIVGFCVGVTGVGGGSLMTPILISFLRVEPHIAIGTDLLYAAISKFCGSLVHAKKLNIVWPIVFWLSLGSIPASLGTSWALEHFMGGAKEYKKLLTIILGAMLVVTGLSIVFRHKIEAFFNRHQHDVAGEALSTDEHSQVILKHKGWVVLMGVALGVLVTLSSVGAGAFGIMALVLLFPKLPMIRIIGSDVAHAVLLTLVAGLAHMKSGNVDTHLLMMLLIGSIPAIIVGTLLSSHLPERAIRKVLGVTLMLLGTNFIVNPVKAKAPVSSVPPATVTHTIHKQ